MKNNPYRVDQYYKYSLQESHELNKAHKELLFGKFLDQRSEFVYLGIIQLIQRIMRCNSQATQRDSEIFP